MNAAIHLLSRFFDNINLVGRKFRNGEYEKKFNRVLFEVEMYYFMNLNDRVLDKSEDFVKAFERLCTDDSDFKISLESTTKSMTNYSIRYTKFHNLILTT